METRPGCRVHAIIVTRCHGNDDEAWSTSCLIMQHKPYIVEVGFMETQKLHDSINGPSLTTEEPPQTNVVHVPMSHLGQILRSVHKCTSLYTAWASLGLLLEMNWHNELALCQFISKSSPRLAQAVYKPVHLCTDLLFAVF